MVEIRRTFEMEQHVRSVIFEHLGNQLHIHILDIDLLIIQYPR